MNILGRTSIVAPVKVDAFSRVLLAHLTLALAKLHVIKKRAPFLNPFSPLLTSNFLLSSKSSDREGKKYHPDCDIYKSQMHKILLSNLLSNISDCWYSHPPYIPDRIHILGWLFNWFNPLFSSSSFLIHQQFQKTV
jgi:hypothetical protein